MRNILIALSTLLAASLSACGTADESDIIDQPEMRPLALRLQDGRTLAVAPTGSTMLVTGRYLDGHSLPRTAAVAVLEGSVDVGVTAQGTFGLNRVTLELGDVIAYPGGVPLHLTDLRVRLEQPIRLHTAWSDDGLALDAVGDVTLLLDWSLQVQGQPYVLAQQRLTDIPVHISVVAMGPSHVGLHIGAAQPGVFWSWGGMLELADLDLDLNASDVIRVPRVEQTAPATLLP